MLDSTKDTIIRKTIQTFALHGYEGFSIRTLANTIPITPSVIYHHFVDKDALLQKMYETANKTLGEKRAQLSTPLTAAEMLRQRIEFQIDNQELIVAVVKYYLVYRNTFKKTPHGFVPDKSSLHIEEVLRYGVEKNEFSISDIADDAKVITHAINGFLLEYYPYTSKGIEKKELIDRIYLFLIRALKGGESLLNL